MLWSRNRRIILGRGLEIRWGYKNETWSIAVTNKVKISVNWFTPLSDQVFKNFNIYSYSEGVGIHIQFWPCVIVLMDLRISGNNCITTLPSKGLPSWSSAFRAISSQLFFLLSEITALSNSIHIQNLFPSIPRFYVAWDQQVFFIYMLVTELCAHTNWGG